MKNYNVTFTEKKKYNALTRNIEVFAKDEYHARFLTYSTFRSEKHINIDSIKEVKKEKVINKKEVN